MVAGRCRFHSGCGSHRIGSSTDLTTRRTAASFASPLRPASSVSCVRPRVNSIHAASGQTRKWRRLPTMSVLPPTTDICAFSEHFRFVPNPDMTTGLRVERKAASRRPLKFKSANQLGRCERHLAIVDKAKHFYLEPRFGQFDALQALRFFAKDVPFIEHVPTGHYLTCPCCIA